MMKHFKDVKKKVERKSDEELVISIQGKKEDLDKMEKTMKAMKDLHEVWGDECCSGGKCC